MQVLIDIPRSLSKYIEYVPEEDLPAVILQALEDKIKSNGLMPPDTTQDKLDSILSILGDIKSGAPVVVQEHYSLPQNTEVVETPAVEENVVPQNIVEFKQTSFSSNNNDDDDEDDDDDDLFDDLIK